MYNYVNKSTTCTDAKKLRRHEDVRCILDVILTSYWSKKDVLIYDVLKSEDSLPIEDIIKTSGNYVNKTTTCTDARRHEDVVYLT